MLKTFVTREFLPSENQVNNMIRFSPNGCASEKPKSISYCAAELLCTRGLYRRPRHWNGIDRDTLFQKRCLVVVPGQEFAMADIRSFADVLKFAQQTWGYFPARPEDVFLLESLEQMAPGGLVLAHHAIMTRTEADVWRLLQIAPSIHHPPFSKLISTRFVNYVVRNIASEEFVFSVPEG